MAKRFKPRVYRPDRPYGQYVQLEDGMKVTDDVRKVVYESIAEIVPLAELKRGWFKEIYKGGNPSEVSKRTFGVRFTPIGFLMKNEIKGLCPGSKRWDDVKQWML